MSFIEESLKNAMLMTEHLGDAIQNSDKVYKKIVLVTLRFAADGEASAKCCKDISKAISRYVTLPAGSTIVELVIDGADALTHPSGRDATVYIREELDDLVFSNQLDELSDHDAKLVILYIVGKGAILTDPLDEQIFPNIGNGQFYAICSNETKNPAFIHYKYLIQDIFVNPAKSQFRCNMHRRVMRKTDVLLLLDCSYLGTTIQASSTSLRTVEVITGRNESSYISRFCKAFQHIVRIDSIPPEPCNIYEMMIYGKAGVPEFHRATGTQPIAFPCNLARKTREMIAGKALKYLDDDFDLYSLTRIFTPLEVSFFGRNSGNLRKIFVDWCIAVGQLLQTQVGYIHREKLYSIHEHELKKADIAAGKSLTTAIMLVPFRYESKFLELHGSFGISVKPITEEMKQSTIRVYYGVKLIERKLGDWLQELDILLREHSEETEPQAPVEASQKKQDE
ncbi:hypothetical protein Dda_4438 [Drechslerella dactyloides]|uniref:Uncharacterized protein n=1 Tax=Drechslerella dactyloides TaxID=74499 RepID=A0AAD6NJ44_DREDA|nr:hypothetical protein Dda_4438 [Drechslerella dactyloides]